MCIRDRERERGEVNGETGRKGEWERERGEVNGETEEKGESETEGRVGEERWGETAGKGE